ncbi:MAG: hypothetical protein M3Q75_02390 [Gemmatimonadota bacterium]|nr:hypothetical protein [Gemmatimonadota bacterium]
MAPEFGPGEHRTGRRAGLLRHVRRQRQGAARLARYDRVLLAPCTVGGTPLGDSVAGRARLLGGAERRRVRWLLRPTGPLFWSYLLYRMRAAPCTTSATQAVETVRGAAETRTPAGC